jgi:hypothetical protein
MKRALDAGDGCVVILGDSRMDAATDVDAIHAALGSVSKNRCLAPLALGATDIGGIALTAREYLSHGLRPKAVVIGKVGDSLLSGFEPVSSDAMIGNNAIHLTWSRPSDVFAEVPGFPFADVRAFDAGFRFLAARATPLGRYQSLFSAKLQSFEAQFTGNREAPRNRFGALGDMALLEGTLRARAPSRLAVAMQGSPSERLGPWFGHLLDLLRRNQIPFIVAELPMRRAFREMIADSPQARAYQDWLIGEMPRWGGKLVDLSHANWVQDGLFTDELHLGAEGATLVSTELGKQLGAIFAR